MFARMAKGKSPHSLTVTTEDGRKEGTAAAAAAAGALQLILLRTLPRDGRTAGPMRATTVRARVRLHLERRARAG